MYNTREFLLGPAYFLHKNFILRSKNWSTQQIFERWNKFKNKNNSVDSIVTKEDLLHSLKGYDNFFSRLLTKEVSTSGSSGEPFNFRRDLFWASQKERAYIFDIWAKIGYKPFEKRVVVRGNFSNKLLEYNWFENAYILSPNHLIDSNKIEILDFLEKLPSFYLHVYPSSLFIFIEFLGEKKFRSLDIKGILAGSEFFHPEQMKYIIQKFNIPVSHWYGHSEYASLAYYCNKCNGFHFYPTYGIVDFIKVDDQLYKIISTSFNKVGTRFINYDTGDYAIINDVNCTSDNFPRVSKIVGREQDFFYDLQGKLLPFGPFLFGIHSPEWGYIKRIQFIQEKIGEMLVLISLKKDRLAPIKKVIEERFNNVKLNFRLTEQFEGNGNKHKYYINKLESD